MNINDSNDAFYLLCFMLWMSGVILIGVAVLVGRTRLKRTADYLGLLGMACLLLAPLMALIGPNT